MPSILSKEKALETIESEKPENECLICWLNSFNSERDLKEGKYSKVVLSKYPRTWGQIMVVLKRHVTSVTEIEWDEWQEMNLFCFEAAKAIEQVVNPVRCYVAMVGTDQNHLAITSPHIHFNIIPVYIPGQKPSEIFTWEHGVASGTPQEWDQLIRDIKAKIQ